jgi:hypothetical protein
MYVGTGDCTFEAGASTLCVEFPLFAMKNNRPDNNNGKWSERSGVSPDLTT